MLRFLADENVSRALVAALREGGCDIAWVGEAAPGLPDGEVLDWAGRDGRVLLTFDKDFGDLARAASLPSTCGVVLFRLPMPPASEQGRRLAAIILAREDWAGAFSVIETGRVRMRPLENLR